MLSVALLGAALTAAIPGALAAAASSSGRPRECAATTTGATSRPSLWERTVAPNRVAYCALLARADARMDTAPQDSQAAAERARALAPERPAPLIALGRAAMRQGDARTALRMFERATQIDPQSLSHPDALHGLAAALRIAGRYAEALRLYRVLVPQLALVPRRGWRAQVLLEAAHVCLALAAEDPVPARLDEAHSYLRRALDDPHHELRLDVSLSLVLVLDRIGRSAQADALLDELRHADRWEPDSSARYLARPTDRDALMALALERARPADAAAAWRRFTGTAGVAPGWLAPARARLTRLESRSPRESRR